MKLEVGLDVCIVVSTEFCKFVYTKLTSPTRLFFPLFPPFIRLNETHSSSLSIFFPPFPSIFHVRVCVTMSLPDDCQRGHMARNTCADNAKKKLIQEQQEAWFFLVYLFCGLNRDRSRLNQEKDCWFSGPVQMHGKSTRGWTTLLTVKLQYSKLPRQQQQKNVLTHAHMLTTGMCTAGAGAQLELKKNFYPSGVLVCVCVWVCVCVCVCVCVWSPGLYIWMRTMTPPQACAFWRRFRPLVRGPIPKSRSEKAVWSHEREQRFLYINVKIRPSLVRLRRSY